MWEKNLKPIAQPPCPDNAQFEDSQEYLTVRRDKWGNEIPQDWTNHDPGNVGDAGQFGSRMFADNDGLKNVNNEYGPEDIQRASTVWVDNSRADRGKES